MWKVKVKSLSRVRLFMTPWTVALQAPPSMGFSRRKNWSGLPFPSPGDLPDPGIEPRSPALRADALTSEPPGKKTLYLLVRFPHFILNCCLRTSKIGRVPYLLSPSFDAETDYVYFFQWVHCRSTERSASLTLDCLSNSPPAHLTLTNKADTPTGPPVTPALLATQGLCLFLCCPARKALSPDPQAVSQIPVLRKCQFLGDLL